MNKTHPANSNVPIFRYSLHEKSKVKFI